MGIVNQKYDACLMLLLAITVVGAISWFVFPSSKAPDRPDRAQHYETRYGDHDGSVADGGN